MGPRDFLHAPSLLCLSPPSLILPSPQVFAKAGKGLVDLRSGWAERIFRDEECADTQGFAVPHGDFRVVVTSWFGSAADARGYLFCEHGVSTVRVRVMLDAQQLVCA